MTETAGRNLGKKYRRRKDIGLQRMTKQDVNILDVVRLRIQHKLQWQEISDRLAVPVSTLKYQLNGLYDLLDVDRREAYDLAKPSILSAVEETLITNLLDKDKLAKASLNNVAYAFTQAHQARRLDAGQTTHNVGLLAAVLDADVRNRGGNAT